MRVRSWIALQVSIGSALAALAAMLLFGAAPSAAMGGCANADVPGNTLSKGQARAAVACLVNKARDAKDLKGNKDLEQAAQKHNNVMAERNQLSHQFPGEKDLQKRVKQTGYFGRGKCCAGETILQAPKSFTPRQAVDVLLGSAPHREILFDRRYKHVGVGVGEGRDSAYYTVVVAYKA